MLPEVKAGEGVMIRVARADSEADGEDPPEGSSAVATDVRRG